MGICSKSQSRVKDLLRPLLFSCGFPLLKIVARRALGKRHLFILLYHKVRPQAQPLFGTAVTPGNFERQMRFLKRRYEIIDLQALSYSESYPQSSKDLILITFDDGYRDNFLYAFPILNKFNIHATIFLATDFIGTNRLLWHDKLAWIMYNAQFPIKRNVLLQSRLLEKMIHGIESFFLSTSENQVKILRSLAAGLKLLPAEECNNVLNKLANVCNIERWPNETERPMLSWEEVREMSEQGISFGSHTRSHPLLSALPAHLIREEISQSKIAIEQCTGKPVTAFAYPYGKKEDYSESVLKILREEGFLHAFNTTIGYETLPFKNPLLIKRKGVPLHPYLFL